MAVGDGVDRRIPTADSRKRNSYEIVNHGFHVYLLIRLVIAPRCAGRRRGEIRDTHLGHSLCLKGWLFTQPRWGYLICIA